jgi:hypothetical protein
VGPAGWVFASAAGSGELDLRPREQAARGLRTGEMENGFCSYRASLGNYKPRPVTASSTFHFTIFPAAFSPYHANMRADCRSPCEPSHSHSTSRDSGTPPRRRHTLSHYQQDTTYNLLTSSPILPQFFQKYKGECGKWKVDSGLRGKKARLVRNRQRPLTTKSTFHHATFHSSRTLRSVPFPVFLADFFPVRFAPLVLIHPLSHPRRFMILAVCRSRRPRLRRRPGCTPPPASASTVIRDSQPLSCSRALLVRHRCLSVYYREKQGLGMGERGISNRALPVTLPRRLLTSTSTSHFPLTSGP